MDRELTESVVTAARALVQRTGSAGLREALNSWAFEDVLNEDWPSAVRILFHELGRAAKPGPALDAVVAHAVGADTSTAFVYPEAWTTDAAHAVTAGRGLAWTDQASDWAMIDISANSSEIGPTSPTAITPLAGLGAGTEVYRVEVPEPLTPGEPVDWQRLSGQLRYAVAAELAGLATGMLDLTVEHVNRRSVLGAPLGSRQVVKHKLADVRTALEAAGATLRLEAFGHHLYPFACKATSGRAALAAADAALQFFGAMAYTKEHIAHRYVRRAWVLNQFLGSADASAAHVGAALLEADLTAGEFTMSYVDRTDNA